MARQEHPQAGMAGMKLEGRKDPMILLGMFFLGACGNKLIPPVTRKLSDGYIPVGEMKLN